MTDLLNQFHFLRPWWLVAIVPAALLIIGLWRRQYQAQSWQQLIAPDLLPYLLDGKTTHINPRYLLGLLLGWIIACTALAGPTWEKRPVSLEKNQQALVLLLDLSPSMLSEDLKPSRLLRARLKIADILKRRQDGYTGLVVYAGDAHVVTPLSDDSKTIINLLPDLTPYIMPLSGSNTEAAISRALQMMHDSGISQGDLLLLTDGVTADAQSRIVELMQAHKDIRLSILGVGTTSPTPIPASKGGFVRDRAGGIVTTQLNISELRDLAHKTGGRYQTFVDTTADIDVLLRDDPHRSPQHQTDKTQREFDSWYDRGHWLALLLLPIVLYSFRRGLLLSLLCLPLLGLTPQKSYAFGWDDLWRNKNQQAYQALQEEQTQKAAELFNDPNWKATADYRAGHYEQAAQGFAKDDSARGHYNRGNALAKAGKLDDAINAYNQALKRNPHFADAQKNRDLVEQAKQQQQQQNQSQNSQSQNDDSQDNQQDGQQQDSQQQNTGNQADKQDQSSGEQQEQDTQQQDTSQQNQSEQQGQTEQQNSEQTSQQQSAQDEEGQELSEEEKAEEARRQAEEQAQREAEQAQQANAAQEQSSDEQQSDEQQALARQIQPDDGLTDEERQAMEQWLRRVPDEPGMLLKNKFKDQYRKRRMQMFNGEWEAPENGATDRW